VIEASDISKLAAILYAFYSGTGLRNILGFDASLATLYRVIRDATQMVYEYVDANFVASRIRGSTIRFKFGKEWEADEKLIPVTEDYELYNGIYRVKKKGSRLVREIIVANIADRDSEAVLASLPAGLGTSREIAEVWRVGVKRAGFRPTDIMLDPFGPHLTAWLKGLGREVRPHWLPKVNGKSQLHLVEGYQRLMDRKLGNGLHEQTPWLVNGVWLHYVFVERKSFDGLAISERASGMRFLDENLWTQLLSLSLTWKHNRT